MRARWMANDPDTLSNAKARRVADSIFGEKDSVSLGFPRNDYLLFGMFRSDFVAHTSSPAETDYFERCILIGTYAVSERDTTSFVLVLTIVSREPEPMLRSATSFGWRLESQAFQMLRNLLLAYTKSILIKCWPTIFLPASTGMLPV